MKRDELLTKAAMEIERWPDEHTPIAHGLPYLCPGIVWGIHADEWCIRYPHVITRDEYLAERERLVLWQAIKPTSEDDANWHGFDDEPPSKYHVKLSGQWCDVYDVLDAFGVTNAGDQHAIKKMLRPGQRGHKDAIQDRREAILSLERAIELEGGQA